MSRPVRIAVSIQDITERKRAEEITERKQADDDLVKEHNLLRTLIDHLRDLVYVKDTESRFVTANAADVRIEMRQSANEFYKSEFNKRGKK